MTHTTLTGRIVGYIASLVLTLTAFLIFTHPDFFHLGMKGNIILLLGLAIGQFIVQSICFLNIWGEKGPRWNLLIFLSTLSIVLIIIVFSIWIMNQLDCNMMCH